MAEKKMNEVMTEDEVMTKATVPYSKEWFNELVPVELFKDNDKYKDDVTVTHNGIKIKIPRGERVMIKRKYALILDNSREQDRYAANMIRNLLAESKKAEDNS